MSGHDRTLVSDTVLNARLDLTRVETVNYDRSTTLAALLMWAGLTENDAATMTVNDLITLCYDSGNGFDYWITRNGYIDDSVTTWEVHGA